VTWYKKYIDFFQRRAKESKQKEERDEKIYDWITVEWTSLPTGIIGGCGTDVGTKVAVFKKGIIWQDWLLPNEKKKYEKLSEVQRLQIAMSCDPINALNKGEIG